MVIPFSFIPVAVAVESQSLFVHVEFEQSELVHFLFSHETFVQFVLLQPFSFLQVQFVFVPLVPAIPAIPAKPPRNFPSLSSDNGLISNTMSERDVCFINFMFLFFCCYCIMITLFVIMIDLPFSRLLLFLSVPHKCP